MSKHQNLTSPFAVHPFAFSSNADPSADSSIDMAPYKAWVNTGSSNLLKVRNAANTAWENVSIGGAAAAPSLGSNVNSVGPGNVPGASTLVTAADHVHLGVRSLSHTSNTFSGPVILTASGTLGITSPTPGTFNLSAVDTTGGGAAGGGGALVLLEQHTASASATLDFTTFIAAGYDAYLFDLEALIPGTTGDNLLMRMGTGGGPTFDAGANYKYHGLYNGEGDTTTVFSGSGATAIGVANSQSTQANYSLNGRIMLRNPSAAAYKFTESKVNSVVGAGNLYWWENVGAYLSTTAVTAIRFLYSTGNIASGTIRVYGISKT